MEDSRVRVFIVVVSSLAVPLLVGLSIFDTFSNRNFLPERMIVHNSSRLVAILSINEFPRESNDDDDTAQNMITTK